MIYKIRIPVYPHVKHYLRLQFGEQLYIDDKNYASRLLRQMITKIVKNKPGKTSRVKKMDSVATIDIIVCKSLTRYFKVHLSNGDILRFSKIVDEIIKQEMYKWCHYPDSIETVTDFKIRRFIDFYGFSEDDLSFDNLKRWFYRNRQRCANRVNRSTGEDITTISYASNASTQVNFNGKSSYSWQK